jgi:hypothetical protein
MTEPFHTAWTVDRVMGSHHVLVRLCEHVDPGRPRRHHRAKEE